MTRGARVSYSGTAPLASPRRVRSLSLLCTFPEGRSGSRSPPAMIGTAIRTRF